MADESPSVVFLTGASSGLGLAIARALLVRRTHRLVLTARASSLRRFDELGIRAGENVLLLPLDVASATERRDAVERALAHWGRIDVLINNAGVAYRTVIEHIDGAAWHQAMEINCIAPLDLARLILPGMRRRRRGHIINISSVGGMMAMPTMSLYSASKFALEGASESLWYEVRPWGIHVSLVQPGFIHSDSFRNTRFTMASKASVEGISTPYHAHYQHMANFIARQMDLTRSTPERVAAGIVSLLGKRHPPLRLATTWDARLFASIRRWMPRGLYHGLLYRFLPSIKTWGGRGD